MPERESLLARIAALERENEELRRVVLHGRDHERFLESVVENIPDMVFVKDARELRFVRFNAAGERLIGLPRASLLGKNDHDLFPGPEAAFFVAKDREVLEGRKLVDIPQEPIHTGAGVRYLHTKKIPILDEQGEPLFLLGISEDITERREAAEALARRTAELVRTERQLRASEARLRVLLEHFPGLVWTTDGEGRLQTVAGARAAMTGLDKAVGDPAWERLPVGGPDVSIEALHREALAGRPATYEYHHGGATCEVRLERLEEEGHPGVIGVAIDVTERRRIEEERMRATLERTQKMETLGLLAGGIAHDFNNLLAAILGNASLALVRLGEADPARASVGRVVDTAETAAELTRQLLAYSGKGRFVIEAVDLSSVVEGIASLLRVSLNRKINLSFSLGKDLPPCAVDVAQLRQVVLNLLTNAGDAIGEQTGTITVATGVVYADRDYLAMAWLDEQLPEGRYVWLEVSDTGAGMDQATQNRMFDPFFTTKDKGHGLGLAATLGIVRGHRGAIRVYSELGKGTSIKVLLPAVGDTLPAPPPVSRPPTGQRRGGCVLVVDDEELIRTFLCDALAALGYRTLAAADGVEALELFRAHGDEVDVVLLDMTMPRMSGEETFRELRRLRPDVRVLLSSGYNEQEATNRFHGKGLAGFLQKPYRVTDLAARLDALLGGS